MATHSNILAWIPGAPQDDAVLTRKFETSHVGRLAASSVPALPRPGHLHAWLPFRPHPPGTGRSTFLRKPPRLALLSSNGPSVHLTSPTKH